MRKKIIVMTITYILSGTPENNNKWQWRKNARNDQSPSKTKFYYLVIKVPCRYIVTSIVYCCWWIILKNDVYSVFVLLLTDIFRRNRLEKYRIWASDPFHGDVLILIHIYICLIAVFWWPRSIYFFQFYVSKIQARFFVTTVFNNTIINWSNRKSHRP